jgi:hypothetical protein
MNPIADLTARIKRLESRLAGRFTPDNRFGFSPDPNQAESTVGPVPKHDHHSILTGGKPEYMPRNPLDWDFSADPGNVWDALDQLASRNGDRAGGGGEFCYDYLVASEWADVVADGRDIEGAEFTNHHGGTYKIFSTFRLMAQEFLAAITGTNVSKTVLVSGDQADTNIDFSTADINGASARLTVFGDATHGSNGDNLAAGASLKGTIGSAGDAFLKPTLQYVPHLVFNRIRIRTTSSSLVHGFINYAPAGSAFAQPTVDFNDCPLEVGSPTFSPSSANAAVVSTSANASLMPIRFMRCSGTAGVLYRSTGAGGQKIHVRESYELRVYNLVHDASLIGLLEVKGGRVWTNSAAFGTQSADVSAILSFSDVYIRNEGSLTFLKTLGTASIFGVTSTQLYLSNIRYFQVSTDPAVGFGNLVAHVGGSDLNTLFVDSLSMLCAGANPGTALVIGAGWNDLRVGEVAAFEWTTMLSGAISSGGPGGAGFWPLTQTPTALTIAAGVVTLTAGQYTYTIDTEAAAASDDLDTINGMEANRLYLFKPVNDARTVVFKHNTGNLKIVGNADITADDLQDVVMAWYDGTTRMLWSGGGGAGSGDTLYGTTVQKTIVSGAITIADGEHHLMINGEGAVADTLSTINFTGSPIGGYPLAIEKGDAPITLDSAGNMFPADSSITSQLLDGSATGAYMMLLVYSDVTGSWIWMAVSGGVFVKLDGTTPLTGDWDAGASRKERIGKLFSGALDAAPTDWADTYDVFQAGGDPSYAGNVIIDDFGSIFGLFARGTPTVPTRVDDGDFLLYLQGVGHDGTTYAFPGYVAVVVDGTGGADGDPVPSMWVFFNKTAAGVIYAALRLRAERTAELGGHLELRNDLTGGAGAALEARFFEDAANGVNYVGFKAPALLAANKIWVLPPADGNANDVLSTDGAANLAWVAGESPATVSTTDATQTTLQTIAIPVTTTVLIETRVTARRTGGSGGTAEDGAAYVIRAAVKNVAGVATLIGAVNADFTAEDQAGWDATVDVNAGNARVRVTGAANNNIDWKCSTKLLEVS